MTIDAAEKAGVPVVRGLVWRAYDNGSCWASDPTGFAAYQALSDGWRHRNGGLIDVAGGIQAAKAAAQADYEQRITAALNPDFLSALDTARAEIERLTEAMTPSGDTKSAYMGEFSVRLPDVDEDGNEYTRSINVPWTTIKEIMAAIKARATLSPAVKEPK